MPEPLCCCTYAVQERGHVAVRVEHGGVAAELEDLADEDDVAADVVVEVLRGDARGRGGFGHFCVKRCGGVLAAVFSKEPLVERNV